MKRSPFEDPYVLARQIGGWLHNFRVPEVAGNDYASAPKLRNLSKGENLLRTRCSACHTLGAGDGHPRVGPNLLGVTKRRERAWLERWLAEPERMLAEKDPIADGLFPAFNRVPMPNMRLNPVEIERLPGCIAGESKRVEGTERGGAVAAGPPRPCCMKDKGVVLKAAERPAQPATGAGGSPVRWGAALPMTPP